MTVYDFEFQGAVLVHRAVRHRHWKTSNPEGLQSAHRRSTTRLIDLGDNPHARQLSWRYFADSKYTPFGE